MVHQPVRFSGTDREFQGPPPLLGEHTREILASMLAIGEDELDTLGKDGVI
jgi:crotonobetainyl-CoA:carnitine CoA-transferase CaiB-like acyl-CoA transferase